MKGDIDRGEVEVKGVEGGDRGRWREEVKSVEGEGQGEYETKRYQKSDLPSC